MLPISSLIKDSFINQPTNIAINIPPRGSKIWLAIRSIESKKFFPKIISTSDQMLKLKTDPIPRTHIKNEIISADLFLDKIPSSERYATPGSSKEIEELRAATDNRIKNNGPINCPNCIWLKAESIETKTNPGPLLDSRLNAKMIGKIAKPANIAIKVSNEATVKDELTTC